MPDRWMTYEEAGALFGLSAEAMRKRARRLRWQVQPPNDSQGKARILVPEGTELRPAGPPPGIPGGHRPDDLLVELRRRAEAAEVQVKAMAAELIHQRERAAEAEGKAATLRDTLAREIEQRERVESERETLAAKLITHMERTARAEGEAAGLRVHLEQTLGRVERAEQEALKLRDDATRAAAQAEQAEADKKAVETGRDIAQEAALADRTAGGPLRRVWTAFWRR